MQAIITPKALALLARVKGDNEMVFVQARDSLGFDFEGRVLDVDGDTYHAEAVNGETLFHCRVDRILSVDVRPFRRFGHQEAVHSAIRP